jgi:site-specific DNA recombinase
MREEFTSGDVAAREAYLSSVVDAVIVSEDRIRIVGSNDNIRSTFGPKGQPAPRVRPPRPAFAKASAGNLRYFATIDLRVAWQPKSGFARSYAVHASPFRFHMAAPREARKGEAWCPWPESNQHSLRNSILSRARLPIPPQGLSDAGPKRLASRSGRNIAAGDCRSTRVGGSNRGGEHRANTGQTLGCERGCLDSAIGAG